MGEGQTLFAPCGTVQAWLAHPETASRGGVVVVQEIFGVTSHIRAVCERLAEAGFTAIAPAYLDLIEPDVELPYDRAGAKRGVALVNKVGLDCAVDVTGEAVRMLQNRGLNVGVVGFCWGGTVAYLGNTRLNLPAVSYYGARNLPFLDEPAGAPLMFHFGGRDPHIRPDAVAEHRLKQPQADVFVYDGADHAFNRDPDPPFDPAAAALAWQRTLAFFTEHLQ
ncbi:MAG: dienelactone hydrolase family protein [Thermomonas sp.]